jgi:pimeloyl-ACP methyl ester carboxylesterase
LAAATAELRTVSWGDPDAHHTALLVHGLTERGHHADLETVKDDRERMLGFPLSELWPRVGCPTLVLLSTVELAGPDEGFILPPQDARRMQETIPDCTLVEVEDTNHYDILYSAPRTIVEAVGSFLAMS